MQHQCVFEKFLIHLAHPDPSLQDVDEGSPALLHLLRVTAARLQSKVQVQGRGPSTHLGTEMRI